MIDIEAIADSADVIVNGYAFTKGSSGIRVINLNMPDQASVISEEGDVLETSMDEIGLRIMNEYYSRNKKFMELNNA